MAQATGLCSLACVLVVNGYGPGLLLAAQVGPVTLLIVRSVLRAGRAVAVGLAMAAAVAAIDLAYAVIGLAGMGRLLSVESTRLWLGLLSAAIVVGIGLRTLWKGCGCANSVHAAMLYSWMRPPSRSRRWKLVLTRSIA